MEKKISIAAVMAGALIACASSLCAGAAASAAERVPGIVIDHSPAESKVYIGSPGLAMLPDGTYVASHDFFGPGSTRDKTAVFCSKDRGASWQKVADVNGQWWSTLFVHGGRLYLLGTSREYGHAVIRRSSDGGRTWTEPKDERSGLLRSDGKYHCAPVPVAIHGGRIWRAMEDAMGPGAWGRHFRAFVMSAPAECDLLEASSWTFTNALPGDATWLGGEFGGWLEGNAIADRKGQIWDILRVETKGYPEKAAMVRVSPDGRTATFDPATGFIDFPGGAKKFTIRHDPKTDLYWCLATHVLDRHRASGRPGGIRNTLALTSSPDLTRWTVRTILLRHPDVVRHGFQYVEWLFEGEDIIAACRTAYDDGVGGAHNNHDANYLTFHRFESIRTKTMADSVPMGTPEQK